jgi:hypothetical protein
LVVSGPRLGQWFEIPVGSYLAVAVLTDPIEGRTWQV